MSDDARIRALERATLAGDPDGPLALAREVLRAGAPLGEASRVEILAELAARWRAELDDALERVALTVPEACVICDALNGVILDRRIDPTVTVSGARGRLVAELSDAIRLGDEHRRELGITERETWHGLAPDAQDELVRRLAKLSPVEAYAILDAVGRFWTLSGIETTAALRAVGLVGGET